MSTVGRGDQRRRRVGSPAERPRREFDDELVDDLPRPRRRWLRFWFCLAAGLGLLFALPMLAATLGAQNWFLTRSIGIHGIIEARSASFGWVSPIVLRDVEIRDRDGALAAKIDVLTSEKSLLGLVFGGRDLGRFTVTHPVVRVVIDDQGSNVEELLRPLLERPRSESGPPSFGVTVDDGVVVVEDANTRRKHEFGDVRLSLQSSGEKTPLKLKLEGKLFDETRPANFELELESRQSGGELLAAGDSRWSVGDLPLDSIEPFLRRFIAGAEVAGTLSMNGHYAWGIGGELANVALDDDTRDVPRRKRGDADAEASLIESARQRNRPGESELRGRCEIRDFSFQADRLRGDRLELERLVIPCQMKLHAGLIDVEKFSVESEIGDLDLSGRLPISSFSADNLSAAFAGESLHLAGKLDLARLARMLPNTVRVRDQTEIIGGDLEISLHSEPDRDGIAVNGKLEATNLAARTRGRRVGWREPLSATIAARHSSDGLVIDQLKCSSSFLQVAGGGTPNDLDATAQFDLAILMDELGKFVDLKGIDLAGAGEAELHFKRTSRGGFTATVDFQAREFQWIVEGRRPWREPEIAMRLDTAGQIEQGAVRNLERASLNIDAGAEQLNVQLAEPIEDLHVAKVPLELIWKGQLAEWLPRIESWMPLTGWDFAGTGTASASFIWSRQLVEIKQADAKLRNFRALGDGWNIDEPNVELSFVGAIDAGQGSVTIDQGDLAARELRVRADRVHLSNSRQSGQNADGAIGFRADLAQLAAWRQPGTSGMGVRLAGLATGNADIGYSRGQTNVKASMTVADWLLADAANEEFDGRRRRPNAGASAWQERKLDLVAKASYDVDKQRLQVERVELAADAIRAAVAGSLDVGPRQTDIDIAGRTDFDWQRLAPLWRQYLPREFEIAGRESREFRISGPWRSDAKSFAAAAAELRAEAGIGWSSASVYGLPIGEAALVAKVDRGRVQIQPLDVAVSGGRLTFAPTIKLAPEPAELQLPSGRIVDRVQLTPEICHRGLKFIAPILAEVSIANGQFSVDVEGARIPLADPAGGQAVGAVSLSAQVRPGPIVEELLLVIREAEHLAKGNLEPPSARETALMVMNDERIDFKMIDRRIYHQQLQFRVGATEITTRGSVGLDDESLAILAHVQIGRQFAIDLPIQGTLTNFQIDKRALLRGVGDSVKEAVQDRLLNELDKGLNRLLRPDGNR